MRYTILILLLAITCIAGATIKDHRKNVKLSPELSQDQVARHQALQRGLGQVGGVPDRTDGSGYVPQAETSTDATAMIADHKDFPRGEADEVLRKNSEEMNAEAEHPKKTAFGILWALLFGALLAAGAWAGLSKFGPKPPDHLR
jgi:hypothetical protein